MRAEPGIRRLGKKVKGYFTVANQFARDPLLTPRATRVGLFVLSHKRGFTLTQREIAERLKMSRTTVRLALDDLRERGYLRTETTRNALGHVNGTDYIIDDHRHTEAEWQEILADEDDEDEDDDGYDADEPDHSAGTGVTSLNTESGPRVVTAESLRSDSVHTDSVHTESDPHKGDYKSKGDYNPQGPPWPPAEAEPDPSAAGGPEDHAAIAIDRGTRRRRGAANLARSARSADSQRVVNAWAAGLNRRPPRQVFADLCVQVDALRAEQYPDDVITSALNAWNAAARSPLALASFAHQAANRTSKPRTAPHHTADSASEASARNFDAFMASQTPPAVHRTALEA